MNGVLWLQSMQWKTSWLRCIDKILFGIYDKRKKNINTDNMRRMFVAAAAAGIAPIAVFYIHKYLIAQIVFIFTVTISTTEN